MKVLCLATEAFGGRGGIAQACCDLVTALASTPEIAEIEIYPRHAPDPTGALPPNVVQHRAEISRLAFTAAVSLGAAKTRDLILCNHIYMAPLAAWLARIAGAKLVVQCHGIEIWQTPTALQRRALESADQLWCVSRYTRARALTNAMIVPERAIVVNNCVRPQFHGGDRAKARARFGFGDEKVVLTVGRLHPAERYKGHVVVMDAVAALRRSAPDLTYVIAGDGDDRPILEAAARERGLDGAVRFLGYVDSEHLPDLYRAADVFAMPSTGEGFGIAFVEAMGCGTPALGLAAAGATDALCDGQLGACVTPDGVKDALCNALSGRQVSGQALSDAVHSRFGQSALRRRVAQAISMLA